MKYGVICSSFDSLDFLYRKLLTADVSFENLRMKKIENLKVKK